MPQHNIVPKPKPKPKERHKMALRKPKTNQTPNDDTDAELFDSDVELDEVKQPEISENEIENELAVPETGSEMSMFEDDDVGSDELSEEEQQALRQTLGFRSFAQIVNDKGELIVKYHPSIEEIDAKEGIVGYVRQFKQRVCYKVNKNKYEDLNEDLLVYTHWTGPGDKFNPPVTTSGEPLDEILADWKDRGYKPERSEYMDVVVNVTDGPLSGEFVSVSISPTSVQAFSGTILKLGANCKKVKVRISVGKKVLGKKSGDSYYPWAFAVIG